MSDHERGLEDDEEETTPTVKRPKFDQTKSRVRLGHVRFITPKKATLAFLKSIPSLFVAPPTENTLQDLVRRLEQSHPKSKEGFTHVCVHQHENPEEPDDYCNTYMTLFRNGQRTNEWISDKVIEHLVTVHPESYIAIEHAKKQDKKGGKIDAILDLAQDSAAGARDAGTSGGKQPYQMKMTAVQMFLILQAQHYCYARMRVSKECFLI